MPNSVNTFSHVFARMLLTTDKQRFTVQITTANQLEQIKMWPFKKQQPAPQQEPAINRTTTSIVRDKLIKSRDFHDERMNWYNTAANQAHGYMLEHERAFSAYCQALDIIDGKLPLQASEELEKQISAAADELMGLPPHIADANEAVATELAKLQPTPAPEKQPAPEAVAMAATFNATMPARVKRRATPAEQAE